MKKTCLATIFVLIIVPSLSYAGFLGDFLKGFGLAPGGQQEQLSDDTVISGLKEALNVSTKNAVGSVSKLDGYFGNADIKILFPEKIRKVADVMSKVGFQKQVDEFVLSMNRAAEQAAPAAVDIFVGAIKEMTFEDARVILNGGDTAATDYFKSKTTDKLYDAFSPVVSKSMDEVGVTRSYKEMMGKYSSIPFVDKESLDLDRYVTNKSLDGLFFMLGQEEKKIRTDPAARVTELLKKVFSK